MLSESSGGVSMTIEIAQENTGAAIWGRLVAPKEGDLTPEVARAWLALNFPPEDHERVGILGAKAQEGTLSALERSELDEYLRVAAELAVIQSKARLSLRKARPDA
jgi:hypothetical protein